jgi:hypothetical protein
MYYQETGRSKSDLNLPSILSLRFAITTVLLAGSAERWTDRLTFSAAHLGDYHGNKAVSLCVRHARPTFSTSGFRNVVKFGNENLNQTVFSLAHELLYLSYLIFYYI